LNRIQCFRHVVVVSASTGGHIRTVARLFCHHNEHTPFHRCRAKQNTGMAAAPEPPLEELLWSIAVARLLLPTSVAVQVLCVRVCAYFLCVRVYLCVSVCACVLVCSSMNRRND